MAAQLAGAGIPGAGAALLVFCAIVSLRLVPFERLIRFAPALESAFQSTTQLLTPIFARPDLQTYGTFLSAVAAVTGVFLALYFTAATAVIGATYRSVPGPVRDLALAEPAGRVYSQWLSFLATLALLFLADAAVEGRVDAVGLVAVTMLTLPSIFAFAALGLSTLALLDPSHLHPQILRVWSAAAADSAFPAPNAERPEYQDFNRRRAASALSQFRTLARHCGTEEHLRAGPLRRVLRGGIGFVVGYQQYRTRIPTASQWYVRQAEYTPVYLASSTDVERADATGTVPGPRERIDDLWLERGILSGALEAVSAAVAAGVIQDVPAVLTRLSAALRAIAANWEVPFACEELARWQAVRQAQPSGEVADPMARAACTEALALCPVEILLGFTSGLEDFPAAHVQGTISSSPGGMRRSILASAYPPTLLERAEFIDERLDFEIHAEGEVISPDWYLVELMDLAGAQAIDRNARAVLALGEGFYATLAETYLQEERPTEGALLLARGREFCWKLERHLETWREAYRAFASNPVNKDLPWPTVDWDALAGVIQAARSRLETIQARLILPLATVPDTPGRPDFAGIAVHESGKAVFEALKRNDADHARSVFPPYMVGILVTFEKLRGAVAGLPPRDALMAMTEPLSDLLELSGLAFAWSDFHVRPELWSAVTSVWDKYLQKNPQALAQLDAVMSARSTDWRMTHRSVLRTSWRMGLERAVRGLPRKPPIKSGFGFDEPEVDHPSALIRRIGRDGGWLGDGGEQIFARQYLRRRPDATGLGFGLRHLERDEAPGAEEDE